MSTWIIVLTAADILIALMLIALVLVQESKSGGFGSSFGSMGESVFGAHAQSHLVKLTVLFGSLFLLITLTLTIITGRSRGPSSAVEDETLKVEAVAVAPAEPAAPAAPLEVGPGAVEVLPTPVEPGVTVPTPEAPPAVPAVPAVPAAP